MMTARFVLGLAALAGAAFTTAARADDLPYTPGNYTEVTDITVDDGHFLDYMKFFSTEAKAEDDFAKSQGWMISSQIFSNPWKRSGEADLFILRTYKDVPNAAEQMRRDAVMQAHFKQSEAQFEAASGERAKFRHVTGSMLLQELLIK